MESSEECPARGKKCNNCQRIGHFEGTCRKRKEQEGQQRFAKRQNVALFEEHLQEENNEERYVSYNKSGKDHQIDCVVGGVLIKMLIDSGSDANVKGQKEWENMALYCSLDGFQIGFNLLPILSHKYFSILNLKNPLKMNRKTVALLKITFSTV